MNTKPPSFDLSGRDQRQRALVPPDKLAETHAWVIGVGAVGRQVALQLAAMGMPRLTLIDDDQVSVENLAPQGYLPDNLGTNKVTATAAVCRKIHPSIELEALAERFKRSTATRLSGKAIPVVFCCVDSIATRQLIWEALRRHAGFFADGRMSAEVIRVLAVDQPLTDTAYAATLFQAEEAYAGSCTSKSTIYTASITAGLMLTQFTRWLRRLPIDPDITLNLLSMELSLGLGTAVG